MALSAFDDRSAQPRAQELERVLGRAAHASDLPPAVLDVIDRATKYAEGRGVRLEVRTTHDITSVERLAAIKMAG